MTHHSKVRLYGAAAGAAILTALVLTPQAASAQQALDEVVVTANRRSENLQDVPIPVTTMTQETLIRAQVRSPLELQSQTPGLVMAKFAAGLTAYIRGIGLQDGSPGQESPVPLYVDGVYIASPNATNVDFNNIERVEVLKGPQGTLFGRTATGGLIQIVTKDPSHTPGANGAIGYGNYNTVTGRLYANTGITEDLAADFAVSYHNQMDGMGRNLATGTEVNKTKTLTMRSKWVYEPTDETKVTLTGDYSRWTNSIIAFSLFPGQIGLNGTVRQGSYWDVVGDVDPRSKGWTKGIAGRLDQSLGSFAKVVSITAYRKTFDRDSFDFDASVGRFSNVLNNNSFRQFTQELQLVSAPESKIKWIVGGFYMYDRSGFFGPRGLVLINSPTGAGLGIRHIIQTQSYAVFGDTTAPLGENTNLTAGVRWTSDLKESDAQQDTLATDGRTVVATTGPLHKRVKAEKVTWRVILDHHFTPDVMVFASASTGFKAGGFNTNSPTGPSFEPEELTAYQAGVKTTMLDGRLRLNLEGYYYKYDKLQQNARNQAGQSLTLNAGKATLAGFEVSGDAKLTDSFSTTFGVTYGYSNFDTFTNAFCFFRQPFPPGGGLRTPCDQSGTRVPKTPKTTFNLSPTYTFTTDMGRFDITGTYYHTSSFLWRATTRGDLVQDAYDLVNLRASWLATNERLGAAIYVKNLTQAKFAYTAANGGTGDVYAPGPKRTFGAELTFKF